MKREKTNPKRPDANYEALRDLLIQRGFNFRSFAIEHGYPIPTVYCAARQTRRGIKSVRIRKHLLEVAHAK